MNSPNALPAAIRAFLLVVGGPRANLGRAFPLDGALMLGRGGEVDIWLDEESVSRHHALVERTATGAKVTDLGSEHGTWLNQQRVAGTVEVPVGAMIQVGGNNVLRLVLQDQLDDTAHRSMVDQAMRDALTSAYNRASFFDQLRKDVSSAIRHKQHLSLGRLDPDLSADLPPAVLDLALRHFARAVSMLVRSEDTFGRIGPRSFALLLRQCPAKEADRVMERIRRRVAELDLRHQELDLSLSVSVGLTSLPAGLATGDGEILNTAEDALRRAKEGGGNSVVTLALD